MQKGIYLVLLQKIAYIYYSGYLNCDRLTNTKQTETAQKFNISPNPSRGIFQIDGMENLKEGRYELVNYSGATIASGTLQSTLNVSHLPIGLYFLRLLENGIYVGTAKLLIAP